MISIYCEIIGNLSLEVDGQYAITHYEFAYTIDRPGKVPAVVDKWHSPTRGIEE